jgi:hypothetical protein
MEAQLTILLIIFAIVCFYFLIKKVLEGSTGFSKAKKKEIRNIIILNLLTLVFWVTIAYYLRNHRFNPIYAMSFVLYMIIFSLSYLQSLIQKDNI